jgi:hypothetical protein
MRTNETDTSLRAVLIERLADLHGALERADELVHSMHDLPPRPTAALHLAVDRAAAEMERVTQALEMLAAPLTAA